jgi:hypothetical protein
LRYLIEESALDLGPAGPDVSHGWGRVDAAKALQLPIDPKAYDVAITASGEAWTAVDVWIDNDGDGVEDALIPSAVNLLHAACRNLGGQVVGDVLLDFYSADVSTSGGTGFDPNGDGDPSDGVFAYIGTYAIPVLGPASSAHGQAIGVVRWEVPASGQRRVAVAARTHAPNPSEAAVGNNVAFRDFVDPLGTESLEFAVEPPSSEPGEPFDLEVEVVGADGARVFLVVTEAGPAPVAGAPPSAGARQVTRFAGLSSPNGAPLSVALAVRLPAGTVPSPDARVIVRTLGAEGLPGGNLTVALAKPSPRHLGGPYHLR